jgi:hypothetical protein
MDQNGDEMTDIESYFGTGGGIMPSWAPSGSNSSFGRRKHQRGKSRQVHLLSSDLPPIEVCQLLNSFKF